MTETTVKQTAGRSRAANLALWALQALLGALFVFSGSVKVTADPQTVAGFAQMGLGNAGIYLIGGLELEGAVALLIPGLAGFAALCLVALMVGAVVATVLTMGLSPLLTIPVVALIVAAIIAWGRRRDTVELVRLLFRR
ncbi:MAG: DoxX family protein [Pseudonocardia sp.]